MTTRPGAYEGKVGSLAKESTPDWTFEGPLEIDDSVWVRIAAAILLVAEAAKSWFKTKEGYFNWHPTVTFPSRWDQPLRIWRTLLTSVCSPVDYQIILAAISKRLDQIYPLFAPWSVLEMDAEMHPDRKGLMVQIYGDEGRTTMSL
jgi:hypothetical protein